MMQDRANKPTGKPDAGAEQGKAPAEPSSAAADKAEAALDEALQETFPASDPIAPFVDSDRGSAKRR